MRIVVTGSSGKLGMPVLRDLIQHGHQVVPIDVRAHDDPALPPTLVMDLKTAGQLVRVMEGADAVCHLANYPYFGRVEPTEGYANNVCATFNVCHAAWQAGVRRIVNASSIQAYGCFGNYPHPPLYLPLDEDHPLLPRDAYPLSKAESEFIVASFVRRDPRISAFSLRFTAIAATDRHRPKTDNPARRVANMAGSLLTFVPVSEAARAVRLCCLAEHSGHAALNIVAPQSASPWTPQMLQQTYNCVPPFRRPLGPTDPLIACERARDMIGFVSRLSAEQAAPR